jgi:hypothetical protein|tara:strand:- start:1973 stop:2200 length:228 start_codon:yes stop_codon:yes gene_type:complete
LWKAGWAEDIEFFIPNEWLFQNFEDLVVNNRSLDVDSISYFRIFSESSGIFSRGAASSAQRMTDTGGNVVDTSTT